MKKDTNTGKGTLVTGKPYRHDIKTAWYTALKKASIADFHFHDLRHTVPAI